MSGKPLPVMDEAPQVPSWRLLATLGGAGALAGLFIVSAYAYTLPKIEANRATVLRGAIEEVLQQPARADTLYLHQGALVDAPPAGVNPKTLERVYRGYDADGRVVGYAITASEAGFQDQIGVIFGYDPGERQLLSMLILSTKETPGLGDKILKPDFLDRFKARVAPIVGLKEAPAADDHSGVLMITGATISSRTVIKAINGAVEKWHPLLEQDLRRTR